MKLKRLARGLSLVLSLALVFSLTAGQRAAADILPEEGSMADTALNECLLTIDGGAWSTAEGSGHLQGICCDDELQYMYFSFTDRLIKVDMRTGEVVGTVTGLRAGSITSGAHLGCLTYRDGYVYGTLEYKVEERWYIAVYDTSKIVGDVLYTDPGVMYAIHVPDVDEDFQDDLNAGEHTNSASSGGHRYGLGGIDGLTFGTLPGESMDSKTYLFLSYAPYGNASRYDNNNQIINVYDPEKLSEYMLPFTEDRDEADGLRCEEQLFLYSGNQEWGTQNLEYDKGTGDFWMLCYGRPSGSLFPSGTMYLIDGSEPLYMDEVEVGQSVPETNEDYAEAQEKAACYLDEDGNWPQANHVTLKCMCSLGGLENHEAIDYANTGCEARICIKSIPASASTGFISLGDDYYYVASSGSKTVDGVSCQWGSASLYKLDRESWTFAKVTEPAKLLLSYTMDAADTYEADGQVYLKDVSGNGCDALVEGTYAAEDMDGNAGGALGFRGYLQGAVFDRVYASEETMAYINEAVEDSFSYSFWVYNEREMDRFTPVIGLYRDNSVQQGLYAGVFEWRYRSAPAVSVHYGAENPEYVTLADGTVSISRPGPGGGDGRTYIHGENGSGYMGRWLHYVVVRSGSAVTVYCNGEVTNSSSANITDSTFDNLTYFEMGGGVTKNWRDTNTRTRFSGMLDDVRLYSGALTLAQAKALYEEGPAAGESTGTGAVSDVKDKVFADSYTGEVLAEQENPIVHYLMDETGPVLDVSGNGIDAVSTQWVTAAENEAGQEGRALAFDGYRFTQPAKVTMTDEDTAWLSAQLNGTGKVTISFWMKATHENGGRMAILGLYDKEGRPMGTFETRGRLVQNALVDGKFSIAFTAAAPYEDGYRDEATYEQLCVTDTYNAKNVTANYGDKLINTWYHVAGELDQDSGLMRLYVDGELVEEVTIAEDTLGEIGYFLIGTPAGRYYEYENGANSSENSTYRQGWAMRGEYVGLVDDVRIYNRILSDSEVEELYQIGTRVRDYGICSLTVLDDGGEELSTLPDGAFTARVTLTEDGAEGVVLAAAYSEDGQMTELHILPAGEAEVRFENAEGTAVSLKVFLAASLNDPTPLSECLEFGA